VSSAIDFGDAEADFTQTMVNATLGRRLSDRWGLNLSAGALVAGTVETDISREDFGPGFAAAVSGSYLAVLENSSQPFFLLGVSLGGMSARAKLFDGRRPRWTAFDLRISGMVGKSIGEHFVPYAAVRLFGGPVMWKIAGEEVTGGDVHKYTLGGGLTARIPSAGFDLFVEGMPIGEQTLSGGATLFF